MGKWTKYINSPQKTTQMPLTYEKMSTFTHKYRRNPRYAGVPDLTHHRDRNSEVWAHALGDSRPSCTPPVQRQPSPTCGEARDRACRLSPREPPFRNRPWQTPSPTHKAIRWDVISNRDVSWHRCHLDGHLTYYAATNRETVSTHTGCTPGCISS